MMYEKPKDIRYTDMCIYIDTHIYTDSYDESLVYQYLYHLVLMIASKSKLFNRSCYYDDFAIFGATRLYLRLTNKKQFEVDASGTPRMKKIRSILNYIHKVIYHLKVDFEQQEYYQNIGDNDIVELTTDSFYNILNRDIDAIDLCEFNIMLNSMSSTCKEFLKTIPYKSSSIEWMNIYLSVLLTFLNDITLSYKSVLRIEHLKKTNRLRDYHLDLSYEKECSNSTILFHLDKSMYGYITVIERELKHIVSKQLCEALGTHTYHDIKYVSDVEDFKDEY